MNQNQKIQDIVKKHHSFLSKYATKIIYNSIDNKYQVYSIIVEKKGSIQYYQHMLYLIISQNEAKIGITQYYHPQYIPWGSKIPICQLQIDIFKIIDINTSQNQIRKLKIRYFLNNSLKMQQFSLKFKHQEIANRWLGDYIAYKEGLIKKNAIKQFQMNHNKQLENLRESQKVYLSKIKQYDAMNNELVQNNVKLNQEIKQLKQKTIQIQKQNKQNKQTIKKLAQLQQKLQKQQHKNKQLNKINQALKQENRVKQLILDSNFNSQSNVSLDKCSIEIQTVIEQQYNVQTQTIFQQYQNKQNSFSTTIQEIQIIDSLSKNQVKNQNYERNVQYVSIQQFQKIIKQVELYHIFHGPTIGNYPQHKSFLKQVIQQQTKKIVLRTQKVYQMGRDKNQNIHKFIDQIPQLIVIIRTTNSILAAYTQDPISSKFSAKGNGLCISVTNKKVFKLLPYKKSVTYDDYYVVFGNSEIRLRNQQCKVFSNFGLTNGFYGSYENGINELLGFGNIRQVQTEMYEFHRIIYMENNS